ncbi:MAG: type II toxin-antitoxin system RelE/ParE family toxin [Candidatus Wallbacteria bacterium]|nr:type II toxin-antitoxin system RelE/ParE family toxin [Candidatus Wallbacteria bacterium]
MTSVYRLIYARSILKDLEKIPESCILQIEKSFSQIGTDPFTRGVKKLKGSRKGQSILRYRSGNYRIIYQVDTEKKIIFILAVKHRKEAYRSN